jgi:hypothetical protein
VSHCLCSYRAAGVADYLRRNGVGVRTEAMTATTKTAAFSALRARINMGGIDLYEEPTLLGELGRLRTKYTAGAASVTNQAARATATWPRRSRSLSSSTIASA